MLLALPAALRCAVPAIIVPCGSSKHCSLCYLYRLLFRLHLVAMAEDLRLPVELLDDGFFHGFFVDGNDKVRNFVVRMNPP